MNKNRILSGILLLVLALSFTEMKAQDKNAPNPVSKSDMLVRISEIEVYAEYLEEYRAILQYEAAESVKVEPGVVAIFPMYIKDNPTQVRIIEIYANREAYQSHLKTPHFQYYKTSTLEMVKSLNLIDMDNIDKETMVLIFEKLK